MKRPILTGFAALLLVPLFARADRLPLPTLAPPAWQAECGSCHLPFPPSLLTASDWRSVMSKLDKHYGDNASLDNKTRQEIEAFLVKNAAGRSRMTGAGDPPRLTASSWFQKEHRKVPASLWRHPQVKSAANCAACHRKAEAGSYEEGEIRLPGMLSKQSRHED